MTTFAVRTFSVLAVTSLALVMAGPAAATSGPPGDRAAGTPPPGSVVVESVTMNGTGCPSGSVHVIVAPDNASFVVSYQEFRVQVGGASKPPDARKNCQVNVRFGHPPGYEFAVNRAEYEGYAGLATGSTATLRTGIYFAGTLPQTTLIHRFDGPLFSDWRTLDEVPRTALDWSQCEQLRGLNINTSLLAQLGTASPRVTSFLALGSGDGTANAVYGLTWRGCP